MPSQTCGEDECLYSILLDAQAFEAAGVAVSLWVAYYYEGETPTGTELLAETDDQVDRHYVCLRVGRCAF